MTGDPQIDEVSRQGLAGLSKVLTARTALEPAEPMGVDIDKDELAFFPVLYWPVREDAEPLSDATLAKVDAFMKQGGFIIFDTRDQDTAMPGGNTQSKALSRLIGQLDVPPLEPVPETHVLTKSFYLMQELPRPLRRRHAVGRSRAGGRSRPHRALAPHRWGELDRRHL